MLVNCLTDEEMEATEMSFYNRMLRIPWMELVRNKQLVRKIDTKRTLIIKVTAVISWAHGNKGGQIDGKRVRMRQQANLPDEFV